MTPEQHQINELEDRVDELESRLVGAMKRLHGSWLVSTALLIGLILLMEHAGYSWWIGAFMVWGLFGGNFVGELYSKRPRLIRHKQEFVDSTLGLNIKK